MNLYNFPTFTNPEHSLNVPLKWFVSLFQDKMQAEYSTIYGSSATIPIDKRLSSLSVSNKQYDNTPDYAINRFSQKYDSYKEFICR